jgi:DNA polymerase
MPDAGDTTAIDLAIQLMRRLEGLQQAGVDWLPRVELPQSIAAAQPQDEAPPKKDPNSPELRRQELTLLAERVSKCQRCSELVSTRRQTVFGVGPVDAELCFVGEAPGADEDRLGEPFVGAAGQLLNRIITGCGLRREDIYICNILRCRPPGNRTPKAEESANCREYLLETLELVQPKFICALGATAAQNLLNTTTSIGKLRGKFYEFDGIPVICTYHPSYLLKNNESVELKKLVWEDMKLLLTRMGKPIPGKR